MDVRVFIPVHNIYLRQIYGYGIRAREQVPTRTISRRIFGRKDPLCCRATTKTRSNCSMRLLVLNAVPHGMTVTELPAEYLCGPRLPRTATSDRREALPAVS